MTVLVTGGSGVLGVHTVGELVTGGYEVVAFSTSGQPEHVATTLGNALEHVRFVRGDVRDFERLQQTVEEFGVEGVVHTAALTGEAQARARPHDVLSVNVAGSMNVFEVARQAGLRRVVYVGSASEYGRRTDLAPIQEDEINVEGLYSESKYVGHRLGQRYRSVFGLDVVTARVSSVYGPHTRFNTYRGLVGNPLIALLCRNAARHEATRLDGGADYPRGWTYAADAAKGLRLLYEKDQPRFDSYNIASGESYRLREVVDELERIDSGVDVQVGAGAWDDDQFQAGNYRGPLDISRARQDLGFHPDYSLRRGLESFIAWWREVEAV